MSTIDVAQLDLVNVAPELDVQVRITREEFETRCAGMATEFKALIAKALADASIEASALHSIELLVRGGALLRVLMLVAARCGGDDVYSPVYDACFCSGYAVLRCEPIWKQAEKWLGGAAKQTLQSEPTHAR